MITRKELKEAREQILWEADELQKSLEEALKLAKTKKQRELLDYAIDNYGCVSCAVSMYHWGVSLTNRISECLDEIDRLKGILEKSPKLVDYVMAFDQIQADVKRWDKILFPEDYKSNEG